MSAKKLIITLWLDGDDEDLLVVGEGIKGMIWGACTDIDGEEQCSAPEGVDEITIDVEPVRKAKPSTFQVVNVVSAPVCACKKDDEGVIIWPPSKACKIHGELEGAQ